MASYANPSPTLENLQAAAYGEHEENGTLFKQDNIVMWRCTNCGMWHIGTEAPKVCPACLHEQGYFISEGTTSRCDTNEGFCEYSIIDD